MWWHILGVNADDDEHTVKKAYAEMIKDVDQDKEIDTFTKIHQAYRMALKSFKKEAKTQSGLSMYDGAEGWYLRELDKIYRDPRKRLKVNAWINLFACMSFQEEEKFKKEYVDFFNEHYYLTEDIWQVVEKNYPLSNKKNFMWHELINGEFILKSNETTDMAPVTAMTYVETKIDLYFAVLNKSYRKGLRMAKSVVELGEDSHIWQWYLISAMGADKKDEALVAYNGLKRLDHDMAAYLYGGYVSSLKQYDEAMKVLTSITSDGGMEVAANLVKEAGQSRLQEKDEAVCSLPWHELEEINPKMKKLLGSGEYKKTQQSEGIGTIRKILGR